MKIILLTTLMIFSYSASAGLYKWVDDEGNVHYSQKRPLNQQFKRLKAPAPVPNTSKPLYQSQESKKNKEDNDIATETAKNEQTRATNCTNAKKNLNTYQVYRRIKDKNGNVTILDDKVRASEIAKAKQAINDFCN